MKDASPEMMSLFCSAVEQNSPTDRATFLAKSCGSDPQLRARLEKLLAAHDKVGGFLSEGADCSAAGEDAAIERPAR